MCPPLYARFRNGLVYGFIKGNVSTVEELGQEKTAEWIAKKLGKWHQVQLPQQNIIKSNTKEQRLWSTMFKWLDQGRNIMEKMSISSQDGFVDLYFSFSAWKVWKPQHSIYFWNSIWYEKDQNRGKTWFGEVTGWKSDRLVLVGTFDPRIRETRVSYCLFSQWFAIRKHHLWPWKR